MVKNKFMQLLNQDEQSIDLYIYGDIVSYAWWEDDVDANTIKNQIKDLEVESINVHINSYGGDVFTGIAIYNMLRSHKAKINVYIDSCACSIASVIAMAGDKIYMPKNTLMMIHNCWTWAVGNSKELRKTADDMDTIMNASIESYLAKVNIDREKLVELLDTETWLTAEECVEMGFADEVISLKEEEGINQRAILFNLVQKTKKPVNEKSTEEIVEELKLLIKQETAKNEISEVSEDEEVEEETNNEEVENDSTQKTEESLIGAFLNYIRKGEI
ncbi:MAG: Clp protease ClpP [Bacilli bacterium]|nr:Clp protease ClpP [Bacilli bacterium]